MKKIGFIGLGTMGGPMAKNLLAAGYELRVFNRTEAKSREFVELGATLAASPAVLAGECEVVITMLAADNAVKEVILGPGGVLEGARPGLILVDSSTISPATSRQIAAESSRRGVEALDAPVTGSKPQAIAGQLTFIVGGRKEVYEKCLPLFDAMGKKSFHVGANGSGSYAKLANNLISAVNLAAFAEGVVMAAKAGIDPALFVEIISLGGARSGQIDNNASKVLNRDFRPNFAAALMYKDLGLAGEVARELNLPTPVAAAAREMLNATIASGFGQEDYSALVKCYEQWAHIEVGK